MQNSLWLKMHGGTTHFPIALMLTSVLFDLAGSLIPDDPKKSRRAGLHTVGFYTLLIGTIGALGAVLSGLVISQGQLWGRGDLARHHAFLWPAFGLMTGLAMWRLVVGQHASGSGFRIYLLISAITGVLMGTAGYWGGELLLNG